MVINEKTKISEIIKENKESIEAIASVAKPLKKLKNPILRKVMAKRVTLSEAAGIGGCKVEDLIKILAPLGFDYKATKDTQNRQQAPDPAWLAQLSEENINRFDVRNILEEGGDPLKPIMQEFKKIKEGEALCIIVNFKPVPLISRLGKKKNIKPYIKETKPGLFETYFYKMLKSDLPAGRAGEEAVVSGTGKITKDSEADFKKIVTHFSKEKIVTTNVKDLPMPEPRMTILGLLEDLKDGHALYVYHKRVPVFLLEDLADMDFEVHLWEIENERDVRLLLFKSK